MPNAIERLELGPAPTNENCVQVGSPDYASRARAECRRFITLLTKLFPPPEGGSYGISSNPHDFGTYYEVVAKYDPSNTAAMEWAFRVEEQLPEFWEAPNDSR